MTFRRRTTQGATCLILLLLLSLLWGCKPAPEGRPEAKQHRQTAEQERGEPDIADIALTNVTAVPDLPELVLTDPASSEEAPSVAEEVEPIADPPDENPPEKVLLMTTAGPLLIEIRLWVDGRPHTEAMQGLVDRVLGLARQETEPGEDAGDETVQNDATWDRLLDHPAIRGGLYGNLSYSNPAERQQLLDRYDVNRNGKIEPSELVRFLTRNRARGKTFSIRPKAYLGDREREESLVWQWLDLSGDRRLDSGEMAAAADRLRVADLNNDELVTLDELRQAGGEGPLLPGMMTDDRRRFQGPASAHLLEEETNWGPVLDGLERIYRFGGPVTWSLLAEPEQLAALDPPLDPARQVGIRELPRLLEIPAPVLVEVRLGQRATEEPPLVVSLLEAEPSWQLTSEQGTWQLTRGEETVIFRLRDLPSSAEGEDQLARQFRQYDTDGNDYLTEEEFAAAPGFLGGVSFEAADLDGNGQLYLEEARQVTEAQTAVEGAQVRLQSREGLDPLFWRLDEDRDGRLSAREIAATEDRLSEWAEGEDRTLRPEQIPGVVVFEIYRGPDDEPNRPSEPLLGLTGRPTAEDMSDRPRWHQAMDSNQDGDVSRREFVGTDDQFSALDADGDGLISAAEASRWEAAEKNEGD